MIKTSEIINFLEHEFSNISHQSKWDNSGKQVFTGDKPISKIALSLDATKENIINAINMGCELLITHHPLFFKDSKNISITNPVQEKAIIAIKGNLDILSYHTNLDMAEGGLNDYVAELLGFEIEDGNLSTEGMDSYYKLAVYTPYDFKDKVFSAITKAGAGKIGDYEGCGFIAEGAGMFTPMEDANPFIGNIEEHTIVDEVKIETILFKKDIKNVLKAMHESHPYEEVAFDLYKLDQGIEYGFGRICKMDREYSLEEFVKLVKEKLNLDLVTTNMKDIKPFSRFGICTGSGVSLWRDTLAKNCNVLLTGDMKYHDAMDAADAGVCIIDATHQGTEEIFMTRLGEILKNKFNVEINILKQNKQIVAWGQN